MSHSIEQQVFQTDLGLTGNELVAERFYHYQEKEKGCQFKPNTKRVIISGFSPFSGVTYNISGVLVDAISGKKTPHGYLKQSDFGGRATNKTMVIGEQEISLCLLVLEVQWDLAAAILLHESQKFKPDFILMSGQGGITASLEQGAINDASLYNGFDYQGKPSGHLNRPVSRLVLKGSQVQHKIALNWDTQKIAWTISPMIEDLGFSLKQEQIGRRENNYICNNISFVMAHGIQNTPFTLAGDLLDFSPRFEKTPKLGFFHYPQDNQIKFQLKWERIKKWKAVILKIVESEI